ncbi:MAG: hypothetical protein E4G77_04100 [Nitrosopumilus sp.]|nr:MAG: hypothetical protein E4G77_04100 [Nitrosopumilus sp.]
MISLKVTFVIFVLISSVIFTPSYSFAQSNQDENPLSSLLEILRQIFSFEEKPSDSIIEFREATVIQTSSTSSTEDNIAPRADAGPDQTVLEFATVILDGSSSTDVDGTIQSYLWTQVSDPPVKLSSTSIANPTFEAPKVESDDIVLRFSLKVTDDFGDNSTDQIDITVTNVHYSPTANAGPDQTVLEFTTATLDGSSSTDTNGDIKLFDWSQTDGPHVTLSSSTSVNPTFTSPDVDSNIVLIFNLKVTDDDGDMDDDNVKVTVKDTNDDDNNDDNKDDDNNDDNKDNDNNDDDNNNDNGNDDDNDNDNDEDHDKDHDDDKGNKVTICHRPPGNPNNSHTITVGEPATNAHLRHGDFLGECKDNKSNDDHDDDHDENDENRNGNSGKGNKDNDDDDENDENRNGNSGKGNKDNDDDDDKKGNSGKGNSGVDNPGKGNKEKDDEKKGNSGKGNSDVDNSAKGNKDNPGKGNKDNPGKGNKDKDDDNDKDDD